MKTHLFIPDVQAAPDTPTDHLRWIGKYIVEVQPDEIIQIGDFADMPSLSTYAGQRELEGKRYIRDIDAARRAMQELMDPLESYWDKQRRCKVRLYNPGMHLTLGNHEYRIQRVIDRDAKLDGFMGAMDLGYEEWGWEVYPFLEVLQLDGIHYAHYFVQPQSGRPYSGENIELRLKNIGFSFSMGHQQILKTGQRFLNNGQRIRGLIAGSCYLHDEHYRGPQANGEWRGIIVKHEVRDGQYDLMEVSLDFLCRKYEGCHVWEFMREEHPEIFEQSTWMKYDAGRTV